MAGLLISFEGLDADNNRVEAFSGIESASGIARSLTMIGHYVATGQVRQRFPFDNSVQFYLVGTEEGSFNWKIALQISGALALNLSASGIYDLSKLVLSRCVGQDPKHISTTVSDVKEHHSGDIDALVEAIEPALKKGHYGIGVTVKRITIKEDGKAELIAEFDSETKRYLNEDNERIIDEQDVSVSALNINNRTGRAYFLDLGRTVPFRIARDADPETIPTLSASLNEYANKHEAPVRIRFRRIEAYDGRLKRVILFGAQDVSGAN